ncbi:tripartite tricarboxylate transporter substrate binding protein [Alphaproteobacteria bacterium]|nr:tripartite tricarboxylate transporter substrate binding protein [Alphaproteobacteria bacterium]MDB9870178.1 tripartite tricarboxylate transporter substrate binding protein [Alphaproteobacteria bacterium]
MIKGNNSFRRKVIKTGLSLITLTGLGTFGLISSANADKYPNKPIELVIHAKYGGGTDTTARMVSIRTRRNLGTDISIVAKRGGSGAKAQNYVLSKPADGYTIMALTQSHLYTMARGKSKMKIDDIVGVARAMDDPTFIAVSGKSNYKTLEDLVSASKKGPLNWGVAQIGGTEHIGLAQFAKEAGIKFKVVPFGSGAQMVQALMAGKIDATLPNVSEAANQVADGSFRALAVMAENRLKDYPNVPSTYEKGIQAKCSTTRGYAVLASTPQPIIDQISKAMVKAMKHDVFSSYLSGAGLTVESSVAGTKIWDKHLKAEYKIAASALKELGLVK